MDKTVAIIGCAHPHLRDYAEALSAAHGLSVAFLWDRDAKRAEDAACAFGLRATRSIATETTPDGFLILSETCHHRADVSRALRARRPIFLEKPLARSRSEARAVFRLIDESGVAFHTGFFLRSVPAFGRLRDLVRAGRLGTVGMVRMRFSHDGLRAGRLEEAAWLTRHETAGYGGFGDLAIHAVDLLAWLGLGPLEPRALGLANVRRPAADVDDFGVALLRSPEGTLVSVEAGWMDTASKVFELSLLGSAGWCKVEGDQLLAYLDDTGGIVDLGAVVLNAADGLSPFLDLLRSGTAARLVLLREARAANLVIDDLYQLWERAGAPVGTRSAELPVPNAGNSPAGS